MKRLLLGLLLAALCLNAVFADPLTRSALNQFIEATYHYPDYFLADVPGVGAFNDALLQSHQIPVYGAPHGDSKTVDGRTERRFLGYNQFGESVSNPYFPYDVLSAKPFRDMNWIEQPWKSNEIIALENFKNIRQTYFDSDEWRAGFKDSFLLAMQRRYGATGKFDSVRDRDFPWERYYHIILPPTADSYGVAILFHRSGDKIWYIDAPLAPFNDLVGNIDVHYRDLTGRTVAPSQQFAASQVTTLSAPTLAGLNYRGYGYSDQDDAPALSNSANQVTIDPATSSALQHCVVFYYAANLLDTPTDIDGQIVIYNPIYDVARAIPSGESVAIEATVAQPVLFDYRSRTVSGSQTYTVNVTKPYSYHWTEPSATSYHTLPCTDGDGDGIADHCPGHFEAAEYHSVDSSVTRSYQISRDYLYYVVDALYHDELDYVAVHNAKISPIDPIALTLADGEFVAPTLTLEQPTEHLQAPTLNGASYDAASNTYQLTLNKSSYPRDSIPAFDFSDFVEAELSAIRVRNDKLQLGTQSLLDGSWTDGTASAPRAATPYPTITLRRPDIAIGDHIANGNAATTGQLHYRRIAAIGLSNQAVPDTAISGNAVTVHTPVYNDSRLLPMAQFDQRPQRNDRQALPLDAIAELHFGTSGRHIDAPGYGQRDYRNHARFKRLFLPFDAYYSFSKTDFANSRQFLARDNWLEVPLDVDVVYLKLPAWVDEGPYRLISDVVASNAATPNAHQAQANLNLANDCARYEQTVEVTGRLFDLLISGVDDPLWQPLFKQKRHVWFASGSNNKNGVTNRRSKALGGKWPYTLPLMPGKQILAGYDQVAIKLGYPLHFSVKTMGSAFKKDDVVTLAMQFFHIDSSGRRQPVDLYYRGANGQYIQIGSASDVKMYRAITAKQPLVNANDIADTADAIAALGSSQYGGRTDNYQAETYRSSPIYTAGIVALGAFQRTFIGSVADLPAGVDPQRARAAVQCWHGSYCLPNSTIALPRGTDIKSAYREAINPFLNDGYIAVNATIGLSDMNDIQTARLAFVTDHSDEWQIEGYDDRYVHGDIAYFYVAKRASDDLRIK